LFRNSLPVQASILFRQIPPVQEQPSCSIVLFRHSLPA
jgi:hypothetical protein